MSGSPNCGSWPRWVQNRADALFFAGDLGQRIFQQPFSWRSLGSMFGAGHIRCGLITALPTRSEFKPIACCHPRWRMWMGTPKIGAATVSVFNGPAPEIETFDDPTMRPRRLVHGSQVGSNREFSRARSVSSSARAASFAGCGTPSNKPVSTRSKLSDKIEITPARSRSERCMLQRVLEFRAVAVMRATTRSSHPRSASRMSRMMPISKKFMTANGTCFMWRAPAPRDHVLVTGVEPASEFLTIC